MPFNANNITYNYSLFIIALAKCKGCTDIQYVIFLEEIVSVLRNIVAHAKKLQRMPFFFLF